MSFWEPVFIRLLCNILFQPIFLLVFPCVLYLEYIAFINHKCFITFSIISFHSIVPDCDKKSIYCQTSNVSRPLVGNKIVDHSDVVGAALYIRGLTIDGLPQDCGNSSVLAMELRQSCAKPLIDQLLVTFKSPCKLFNYNKVRPKQKHNNGKFRKY